MFIIIQYPKQLFLHYTLFKKSNENYNGTYQCICNMTYIDQWFSQALVLYFVLIAEHLLTNYN